MNVHFLIATFLLGVCTILSGVLFNKNKEKKNRLTKCCGHFHSKINGCGDVGRHLGCIPAFRGDLIIQN